MQRGEVATDQDPTISLDQDCPNWPVGGRVERGVDGAIHIQARQIAARSGVARSCAERRELSTDQHFAVGLSGERIHVPIHVGIEAIKGGWALTKRGGQGTDADKHKRAQEAKRTRGKPGKRSNEHGK